MPFRQATVSDGNIPESETAVPDDTAPFDQFVDGTRCLPDKEKTLSMRTCEDGPVWRTVCFERQATVDRDVTANDDALVRPDS